MNITINTGIERMLEPINLAIKKVRAIELLKSIRQELESAEKRLDVINKHIETAEKELFDGNDEFSAFFTYYDVDYSGERFIESEDTSDVMNSVKEFVDEYVNVMTQYDEIYHIDVSFSLNDLSARLTMEDKDLRRKIEEREYDAYFEIKRFLDTYGE